MSNRGFIKWQSMKEATPPVGGELILLALDKNGHARFIPKAMFGLGSCLYEIFQTKDSGKGVEEIVRREILNLDDYEEICWSELNVPEWWSVRGEKNE